MFIVRNVSKTGYLAPRPAYRRRSIVVPKPHYFETRGAAEAARRARPMPAAYRGFEVTWGLRWFLSGKPITFAGYACVEAGWTGATARRQAFRFVTPAHARAVFSAHPEWKEKNTIRPESGFRVVRFLKMVTQ